MLKSNAVAITLPFEENDFKGIVDLVKNEAIVWHDDTQATFDVVAIPEEMKLKNTDLFLLKRLLIMMKICWRNSWKMKTLLQRKKSTKH
jgi:translation elongation factor EF-G